LDWPGLTAYLSGLFKGFGRGGVWGGTYGVGVSTAVLSSIMNNMPTVLIGALAIQGAHVAPAAREAMVYANVIGCDLGPKFTPIGSLATLLWLHVLAQKASGSGGATTSGWACFSPRPSSSSPSARLRSASAFLTDFGATMSNDAFPW
jgi:hypothetical protein